MAATLDSVTNALFGWVTENPWKALLGVTLTFYGSELAPPIPDVVQKFFHMRVVRMVFLFVMFLTVTKDPSMSIILAIAYIVIINKLAQRQLFELFVASQDPGVGGGIESPKNVGGGDRYSENQIWNQVAPY